MFDFYTFYMMIRLENIHSQQKSSSDLKNKWYRKCFTTSINKILTESTMMKQNNSYIRYVWKKIFRALNIIFYWESCFYIYFLNEKFVTSVVNGKLLQNYSPQISRKRFYFKLFRKIYNVFKQNITDIRCRACVVARGTTIFKVPAVVTVQLGFITS